MNCDNCKHYCWYYDKCSKWNCKVDAREVHQCFESTELKETLIDRKDCPMRSENGNCIPVGGFCTAVSEEYCAVCHNAYSTGFADAATFKRSKRCESIPDRNPHGAGKSNTE